VLACSLSWAASIDVLLVLISSSVSSVENWAVWAMNCEESTGLDGSW